MPRSSLGGTVVAGLLMLATACGAVTPKLKVAPIERAIEQSSRDEFAGAVLGHAHCPAGRVVRAGDTFTCTLEIDHQQVHFRVRQSDGHGAVSAPVLVEPFALVSDIGVQLAELVRSRDLVDVKVTCGSRSVVFLAASVRLACLARYDAKTARRVTVRVDRRGDVVAYVFRDALIETFSVSGEISQSLTAKRGHTVYVECGDRRLVLAVGATFTCKGADAIGAPLFSIRVTIANADGRYRFTLAGTPAG